MIINAMERITKDLLDQYRNRLRLNCSCTECLDDILALTLNSLKPRYVTKEEKVAYIKAAYIDKQEITSLIVKLTECAKLVSDNPQCETFKKEKDANHLPHL